MGPPALELPALGVRAKACHVPAVGHSYWRPLLEATPPVLAPGRVAATVSWAVLAWLAPTSGCRELQCPWPLPVLLPPWHWWPPIVAGSLVSSHSPALPPQRSSLPNPSGGWGPLQRLQGGGCPGTQGQLGPHPQTGVFF